MQIDKRLILFVPALLWMGCKNEAPPADANGHFEATEVTVSAEVGGRLLMLKAEEGQTIQANEWVAQVDTTLLHLQKEALEASLRAIGKKTQDPNPQIAVLEEQKRNVLREIARFEKLVAEKAALPKQLDDLRGQLDVVEAQIAAARRQAGNVNTGILSEREPIQAQIQLLDEQIRRCEVYNPITGVVLAKLAEPSEMVAPGSPLYRIARLDTLELRAYVSGSQLPTLKMGRQVQVQIDTPDGSLRKVPGRVSWISQKAEFTPKTIQTREERVNLVYAFKVRVPNDGSLKIGMPGEVVWE